jgi:hypothetical protein
LLELGTSEALSRIFPTGLDSVHVEIRNGATGISMRLEAATPAPALLTAQGADEDPIQISGDVQASFNAEGHKVIALIAAADLQQRAPGAFAEMTRILDAGGRDLLSAAIFPDVIRPTHRETAPFHFVDFELEAGLHGDPPLPPAPHVIGKIDEFSALLAAPGIERRAGRLPVVADSPLWRHPSAAALRDAHQLRPPQTRRRPRRQRIRP